MWVDSFHGKNKKFNTFFRNRAKKYGLSIFDKLHDVLSGKYYTKRQTKQIAVNNYMKSTYHWTDTWAITSFGITASSIASVIINHNLSITGFYLTIAFLEEYADFTRGRWVDKKTFEKNSIHKRKNFWGQYYTGTWTDNKYKKKSSVAWNDNSYYLSSHPDFWPAVTGLNWSFHPKDSSEIPAKLRYSLFDKKTVSRYDGNNLVTLYITESTVVPEGIDSGLIQNDHLIVPEGVTLVIDPSYTASGIELKFKPGKYFKVRGSLITKGTLEKPIILKGLSDNPDDDGDKWAGMFFGDFASNVNFGDSELNYTIIKDACKLNNTGGGGIRINNSDLYIDNYAQIIFNNCQFRNCKALEGGAVYIYDAYSHPDNTELFVKFKECIFENNIANRGGAVSALQNYAHFINCVFKNNTTIGVLPEYSGCGGAIDYNGEGLFGYPLLLGNLFVNNSAGSAGAVWFKNNNDYSCSPVIINNTFFNNNAENLGGALSFTKPDDDVILINNVFWGNTANYDYSQYNYVPHGGGNQINVELDDETMSCHKFIFKNNNIQSGLENINNSDIDCIVVYNLDANEEPVALTYSASGNINSDPLLNSEDYSITANSPCFNSGISAVNIDDSVSSYLYFQSMDLYGNPRISSSAVDIGACEAYEEGIYIEKQEINLGNVNPDSPVTVSLVLHNENDEYSVNNINCTLSDETDAGLEIINCPSSVSPGGTEIIKLKFAPEIMYKNYSGKIVINSDDPYFPEFIIPFSAYTGFHGGWNWCSFPFADLNEEDILDSFNPFGLFVKTKNGYTEYNVSDNSWSSHGLTNFENNNCYKVKMSSSSKSYDIDLTGGHPYTSKTLYPGVYNWIGYWLLESKNIDDAFGDDFDKVISIKAETWFYDKQNISRGLIPVPVPSNRIRALHYGRGYMVKVSEIIEDFKWGYSGNPLQKDALKKPTVFTFEQKSDYEAIDIIGLSDGDIEIGAFVDSVCIGAAVAENNQAQILAYTQNSGREEQEIYFKILSERGSRSPEGYFIFNQEKNNFEKGKIISNRNDYHIVAFDKNGELNDNIPDKVVLKGNYPNPFNPSTTINFSIPENSEVNLSIYNVKGQKVRTSINKKLEKGYHKVLWNGKNEAGNFVGSGVYLYRLKVNGKTEAVKKCLMLK
ncbi:MAG: hypothetical protein CSB55_03115 [Candidatus Cloacimonadota bacterium]|nr:MAG: hypothetical protein CSB55_03115 [Candidatus Cloacimonadota bacterium]